MISVEEAIVGRQSTRAFLDKPVARETILKMLEIAGRAPSGSNIQPWKVYVVTGRTKDALSKALLERHLAGDGGKREYNYYPVSWREPYIGRRRECGWGLYSTLGIEKGDKEKMLHQHGRNYDFFGAPVGLFFTLDRDMELGSWLDTGMFIQSVMLAARGLGMETCPQAAFCNYFDTVTARVGIPEDQQLVCGMALGYPDPEAVVNTFRTTRVDPEIFTTFVE
ncbi:MAG: nitroreductase [Alphaproteobacteria bacterium]|nr:nitroreductase [Alphaproteobacteria bacterium]